MSVRTLVQQRWLCTESFAVSLGTCVLVEAYIHGNGNLRMEMLTRICVEYEGLSTHTCTPRNRVTSWSKVTGDPTYHGSSVSHAVASLRWQGTNKAQKNWVVPIRWNVSAMLEKDVISIPRRADSRNWQDQKNLRWLISFRRQQIKQERDALTTWLRGDHSEKNICSATIARERHHTFCLYINSGRQIKAVGRTHSK